MEEKKNYDVLEKELEKYPEIGADIVNVFVHEGKQCVQPERLRPAETETLYRDQTGTLHNQLEDLARYEVDENGEVQMLYLLANQSTVDDRMILRKCGYTGGYYRGQYLKQNLQACPVMELVLYWGQERWNVADSVREFYRDKNVSERAWQFVDNERLHVFEMRYLPREVIERFRSDLRVVVEYITDRHNPDYQKLPIKHADCVLELIATLAGDEGYRELLEYLQECDRLEKEEEWTMCDLLDEAIGKGMKQGMEQGMAQGMAQGERKGLEKGIRALVDTCKKLGVSFDETLKHLQEEFSLDASAARQDMAKYW